MNLWESICAEHATVEVDNEPQEPLRYKTDDADQKNCSAAAYFDNVLMPILSAGLRAMVNEAERENVFKYKKRNKFNGCDFLTEYLYNSNPAREGAKSTPLSEIPFCQEFDKKWPRKELPLSLRLSEDQAATMIQAWYRGVKARQQPEIRELIKYQEALR